MEEIQKPSDGVQKARPPGIQLTEYIQPAALQRVLDGLAAVTGCGTRIEDCQGNILAQSDAVDRGRRAIESYQQAWLAEGGPREPMIPVVVDDQQVAWIRLEAQAPGPVAYFLHLVADALGQMCRQSMELGERVRQMKTLYDLSTLLAGQRSLQSVLNTVARTVALEMDLKACSIRLLDEHRVQLIPRAGYNLSELYMDKEPIRVDQSPLDQKALAGEAVYVEDIGIDDDEPDHPQEADEEGLASFLGVGMIYRGQPLGVMRVYSGEIRTFDEQEIRLLQSIAQLAAAAIRNAQLDAEREEGDRIQRQVELAADVQRRLLPQKLPTMPGLDIAAHYEPSFELAGDFFDFMELQESLGVVVGDVVGKGVAAGLMMASLRATLRAHVEDVYHIDQIMDRVNRSMVRDTQDHEFATLFYGTIDMKTRQLTYCSAGHDPSLLLRRGRFKELKVGGMLLGVEEGEKYKVEVVDLKENDIIVIYTDGITDAMSYDWQRFGRQRMEQAILECASQSADMIVRNLMWHIRRFVGFNRRPDDITLVVMKVGAQG